MRAFPLFIVCNFIFYACATSKNIVHLAYHIHGIGAKWSTDAENCSNVPDKLAVEVTSIYVRDACARLYDDINCEGASIEVLPHSPTQHDLRPWGFDNIAKSIGPCRNPCDPEIVGAQDLNEPLYVQIYNEKNYAGRNQKLRVVGCTVVPEDFVDKILSINTHFHCIQLYSNPNCETSGTRGYDPKSIELRFGTPFHTDLSQWDFPEVKAVSQCKYKCSNMSGIPLTTEISNENDTITIKDKEVVSSQNIDFSTGSSAEIILIVTLVPLFEVLLCVILVLWIIKYYRPSVFSKSVSWAKYKESADGIEMPYNDKEEAEKMSNTTNNGHLIHML